MRIVRRVKRDAITGKPEHKTFEQVEFKAVTDGEPGDFEAIVAVFGNIDLGGDRMNKGAFDRTLRERGLPAIVWTHDRWTVPVGVCKSAETQGDNFVVKGRFFVAEDEDHPVARQIHAACKALDGNGRPALHDFSFGYRVVKATWTEEPDNPQAAKFGGEIRDIYDADLWECGPTLVGMNPGAGLVGIKSANPPEEQAGGKTDDEKKDDEGAPQAPAFNDREHAARVAELLSTPIH